MLAAYYGRASTDRYGLPLSALFAKYHVDERCHVAHVDASVAVEVGSRNFFGLAQNHVDERCHVAHVDTPVAVEVGIGYVFAPDVVVEVLPNEGFLVEVNAGGGYVEVGG